MCLIEEARARQTVAWYTRTWMCSPRCDEWHQGRGARGATLEADSDSDSVGSLEGESKAIVILVSL